ncbi:hypothetical protein R8Z57_12160 [Microbacterium sp. M3]|uniref:Uncharacterized protein n=1 Tax=Microbacterium arthrosphaerae TaxID=792652 RepID=A0ABU4H2H0_9MICO|nr:MULTISPECIES: hypothetical protein [Microbacterium]MDW4573528.1 hypothetical protein [Microbacterium arthrosphaerae]MDW7607383.1 hypothetical protein [Microbacterium sp. M3]
MSGEERSPRECAALSRDAIRTGAVISYCGDELVVTGGALVEAVTAALLGPAAPKPGGDRWLTPEVPVLSRGPAWIVPLFWSPSTSDLGRQQHELLDRRGSELGQAIMSACWYLRGEPLGIELEGDADGGRGYAAELVRTGAKDASWWGFGDDALVLVYYGDPSPAPKTRMALHVVPVGWVSARRPTPAKKMPALNLEWDWAAAVAFAEADAAGSLSEHNEEGP